MEEGQRDHTELFVSTRGAFIKRMIAVGFTVPMIGSFGFTELASAAGNPKHCHPNQGGYEVDRSHPNANDSNGGYEVDTSHPNANKSNGGFETG